MGILMKSTKMLYRAILFLVFLLAGCATFPRIPHYVIQNFSLMMCSKRRLLYMAICVLLPALTIGCGDDVEKPKDVSPFLGPSLVEWDPPEGAFITSVTPITFRFDDEVSEVWVNGQEVSVDVETYKERVGHQGSATAVYKGPVGNGKLIVEWKSLDGAIFTKTLNYDAPVGKIVFTVTHGVTFPSGTSTGESEIFVVNADGSGLRRITNGPGSKGRPRWSPNGQRIAYHMWSRGDWQHDVYVMNSDGNGSRNLTKNPWSDWMGSWSPDGTKIAFLSSRDRVDKYENQEYDIFIVNSNGSNLRKVTDDSLSRFWSAVWSPDGNKIAAGVSSNDGRDGIYTMNPDGSDLHFLIDGYYNPRWSPDGQELLIERNDFLYLLGKNGENPRLLTGRYSDIRYTGACWSPDGRFIAVFLDQEPPCMEIISSSDGKSLSGRMGIFPRKDSAWYHPSNPDWHPTPY